MYVVRFCKELIWVCSVFDIALVSRMVAEARKRVRRRKPIGTLKSRNIYPQSIEGVLY